MNFLGVSGVEDKLQKNVQTTIDAMKGAGIQVWMLTGDRVETGTSIAISAGLKSRQNELYFITEHTNKSEISMKLINFRKRAKKSILIIDGKTLDTILDSESVTYEFFSVATLAPCLCVCRCSPTQKADIVRLLKDFTGGKRIAAVGDGGNDVGMIMEADVGIGIVGKEGMQASLASDFSINQFCYLKKLILWHGRQSYRASAVLSQFVFHRGLIISVIQATFTVLFYFVSIPIYNGFLMLGYSTVYTSLPVFSLVFDQDADVLSILSYPPLYKTMQKGRQMNIKTFCIWLFKSIIQGTCILMMGVFLFTDSFANIVMITFTALIIIEQLNVYSQVSTLNYSILNFVFFIQIHRLTFQMMLMQVASALVYFISIMLLHGYFDLQYIDSNFIMKVVFITFVAWTPFQIMYFLANIFDPSEQNKIMSVKEQD